MEEGQRTNTEPQLSIQPKRPVRPRGRKSKGEEPPALTAKQIEFLTNIDSETIVTTEARVKRWAPFGSYRVSMEKKARLVWAHLKTLQEGDLMHVVCQPQMLINEAEAAVRQSLGLNFRQIGLRFQRVSPQRSPDQSTLAVDSTTPFEVDLQLGVQPSSSGHENCALEGDHSPHQSADLQSSLPLHREVLAPNPQLDHANSQLPALDAQHAQYRKDVIHEREAKMCLPS